MIDVTESAHDIRAAVAGARERGQSIGLVPTMGALHEGHLRLIETCREVADRVVVSIFVNPTQFGPGEDFQRYPRPFEDDIEACRSAGAHLVFAPSVATVYPRPGLSTFVEVPGLSDVLEGACRPGHFRGVTTVVLKLLELVRPDVAVFGQKDYQQQLVIRRMVLDLHVPVTIMPVPTVRECDGLALSSRNRYLNQAERQAAPVLYRALEAAATAVANGEHHANGVRQILLRTLESERLVIPEYAEVTDAETLEPLDEITRDRRAVALVAARLGTTRLIDNILLNDPISDPT